MDKMVGFAERVVKLAREIVLLMQEFTNLL